MKMAAAEALWETADPAPMSLFTWGNEAERRDVFAIKVPGLLSFLAYNRFSGEVQGHPEPPGRVRGPLRSRRLRPAGEVDLLDLPGDGRRGDGDAPARRVGAPGRRSRTGCGTSPYLLALLVPAIALPYIANSTGWIFTEIGREPWIVFGLMTLDAGGLDRGHRRARSSSRSSASPCSTRR